MNGKTIPNKNKAITRVILGSTTTHGSYTLSTCHAVLMNTRVIITHHQPMEVAIAKVIFFSVVSIVLSFKVYIANIQQFLIRSTKVKP